MSRRSPAGGAAAIRYNSRVIVFDLQCDLGHRFEGWFGTADDFAAQKARGILACPSCASHAIDRVPSATRFNAGVEQAPPAAAAAPQPARNRDPLALAQILYSRMLDEILARTEDVGGEFPAEARRMHYEEIPERAIRGVATGEEFEALAEEGVPVARFPVPSSGSVN